MSRKVATVFRSKGEPRWLASSRRMFCWCYREATNSTTQWKIHFEFKSVGLATMSISRTLVCNGHFTQNTQHMVAAHPRNPLVSETRGL